MSEKARIPVYHNLMTVKETAEYLRMPTPSVYYHVQKGNIPTIKIGGRWRILRDRLESEFMILYSRPQPISQTEAVRQELIDDIIPRVILAMKSKAI